MAVESEDPGRFLGLHGLYGACRGVEWYLPPGLEAQNNERWSFGTQHALLNGDNRPAPFLQLYVPSIEGPHNYALIVGDIYEVRLRQLRLGRSSLTCDLCLPVS